MGVVLPGGGDYYPPPNPYYPNYFPSYPSPYYYQVQFGWECPRCHATYSPMCMQCYNCRGEEVTEQDDA